MQKLRQRKPAPVEAAIDVGIAQHDGGHLPVPMSRLRRAILGERVAVFEARVRKVPQVFGN
ncbi:MAG: hypothetical protein JO061_12895 [Acidobacteriaceae bacterium]|nr:hypothetical protein [Acidobacteriaceae bacterium]